LSVRYVPLREGGSAAYAFYIPPQEFVRSSRQSEDYQHGKSSPRSLTLEARPTSDPCPGRTWGRLPLALHRPAVVLIHGLHDRKASWTWDLLRDPRFDVEVADYEDSNGAGFLENVRAGDIDSGLTNRVPREAIAEALRKMRKRGIAATKADVIAHSMGGLLARLYATDQVVVNGIVEPTYYRRADNFYQGDIHKLITVDTPHLGSQVADILVDQQGNKTAFGNMAEPISWFVNNGLGSTYCWWLPGDCEGISCVGCGAVRDLRTDSPLIRAINATPVNVPVHAIVGDAAGCDTSNSYYAHKRWMLDAYCPGFPVQYSFNNLFVGANDMAVSVRSQKGGLGPEHTSTVTGTSALHWLMIHDEGGVNTTAQANARAIELLNAPVEGGPFRRGYPSGVPSEPYPDVCDVPPPAFIADAFPSTGPTGGAIRAGQAFTARANVPAGFAARSVAFPMPDGSVVVDESAPFEVSMTVPLNMLGPATIRPIAIAGNGDLLGGVPLTFSITTTATQNSIFFAKSELVLRNFRSIGFVAVIGRYSDGANREVSSPALGTTYSSADARIATVDARGRIEAHGVGQTTITARNGTRSATLSVVVESIKGDANCDGMVDELDAARFVTSYTGPREQAGFVPPPADAADPFDFDQDGDVDCADWQAFRNAWTGAGQPRGGPAMCPNCLADVDDGSLTGHHDGGVTIDDLLYYITIYADGVARADIDDGSSTGTPDGGVTIEDLLYFLLRYEAGC
jgi:pimeloyl-ACP methyl ester carboxylesterase